MTGIEKDQLKPDFWPLERGRIALFCAALAPSSIWLLSQGALARPLAALGWSLVYAGLVATIPVRSRLSAWLQALLLPWTLGWIATVAITGMGPSNAVMASATKGAFKEVFIGLKMALANYSFLASALLTIVALAWAFRATAKAGRKTSNIVAIVFLCLLIPGSAAVLDVAKFVYFSQIIGPEARTAVPWLSHLSMAKEVVSDQLELAVLGQGSANDAVRSAALARKQFEPLVGLGVLVIGESLRADALLDEGRGEWSKALGARLAKGLGVRLPDACAGANSTFLSAPRLLTAVDVNDSAGAKNNPTMLAVAKAGGARTAYINNHEIWVVPESGHDFMAKTASMQVNALDEVAVEALADFVKRTGPGPKAAVLHMYGQHLHYEDRYPLLMFPGEPAGLDADSLLELRYRRSAEYNVRMLLQAADLLDAQHEPAFLVFTSDHGENLPSDKTGKRFHSGPSNGRFDTIVPVLVLWNRAFADSGKPRLLDGLLKAPGLIAHQDVARAWLGLEGMPGDVKPTARPMTWGALLPGEAFRPISCAALPP